VAKGNARFRFQVMPSHTDQNLTDVVERFCTAVDAAKSEYERHLVASGQDRRRQGWASTDYDSRLAALG
jgi:hypothetical protein